MNTERQHMSDDARPGINPTIAFLTVAALVAIGVVGSIVVILIRPDATATFSNTIIVIIGIAISFAGTAGIVAPIARKTSRVEKAVDTVRTQTNGTLTKLLARNRDLVHALNDAGIDLPKTEDE